MKKVTSGHYHEIMDRCHIIMSNICDHIIDHPGVDKEMVKLLDEAISKIYKVYCKAGMEGESYE